MSLRLGKRLKAMDRQQKLKIEIPGEEIFDEAMSTFKTLPPLTVYLEHSLYTISKWEIEHQVPFISRRDKTPEETLSYIRCMSDVDLTDDDIARLSQDDLQKIVGFINNPMSATKFKKRSDDSSGNEMLTSEAIYGYMAMAHISDEEEKEHWHLNRLIKLIEFIALKNAPKKRISEGEKIRRYADINEANKKRFGVTE